MGIKEKKLYTLESNCSFHLSLANEYAIDWNLNKDDYSLELAVHETIYYFEVYKRALGDSINTNHSFKLLQM